MTSEAILVVQAISLILVILALIGSVCVVKKGLDWKVMALPLLLIINLGIFLIQRILVKGFGIDIPLSGGFINSWAVLLQFQMALTAVVAIGLSIINRRINGE